MAAHANTLWDARAGESSVAALSAAVDAVSVRSLAGESRALPTGTAVAALQTAAKTLAATVTARLLAALETAPPL